MFLKKLGFVVVFLFVMIVFDDSFVRLFGKWVLFYFGGGSKFCWEVIEVDIIEFIGV